MACRVASSDECAALLIARCRELARGPALSHQLCNEAANIVAARLLARKKDAGTVQRWSELSSARIRDSWTQRP
eukprot:7006217-Prymnesium_polylepis.1